MLWGGKNLSPGPPRMISPKGRMGLLSSSTSLAISTQHHLLTNTSTFNLGS